MVDEVGRRGSEIFKKGNRMRTAWHVQAVPLLIILVAGCGSESASERSTSRGEVVQSADALPLPPPQERVVNTIDVPARAQGGQARPGDNLAEGQDSPEGNPQSTQRDEVKPSLESLQWDKATKLFSIAEVQGYLDRYPQGQHAAEAKEILDDERIIADIERNGSGNRFVVPADCLPEYIVWSRGHWQQRQERGRLVLHGDRPGSFAVGGIFSGVTVYFAETGIQQLLPCADRSVFITKGTVKNIVGDLNDPIRFVYFADKGLIHIAGKGKVLNRAGAEVFQTP